MPLIDPPKQLLGPDGRPISSQSFQPRNTKAPAPITGNAFGQWAGRDRMHAQLPGGALVQFDLSKLTVADFRGMRDHYQVNASLSVLSFMQHQCSWHIECADSRIASFCEEQLRNNWTMLNRTMSQANWAGYSPSVLEWENDPIQGRVNLARIKDLVPEECFVNWKWVDQWAPPNRVPPRALEYDGIRQWFWRNWNDWDPVLNRHPGSYQAGWPIPADNTFWYSLLMENGDYYGRKLLRPAFQAWYFSLLMHLFANRYYERFGEPTPIGRAPFDDTIKDGASDVAGNTWMLNILQQLRNRSVVVLPNDTHQVGATEHMQQYDYTIDFLESQMRGADFERYLTRLDEEISIGMFTPILLLRTADVGSYNLGTQHKGTYNLMLDAVNDDRGMHIDNFILSPMVDYNFTPNAPRAKIVFHKLGNDNLDILGQIIIQLVKQGAMSIDLDEAGQALGMTLKQVKQTTTPPPEPGTDPNAPPANKLDPLVNTKTILGNIKDRVRSQVANRWIDKRVETDSVNMGFKNRLSEALEEDGLADARGRTDHIYSFLDHWLLDVKDVEWSSLDEFMGSFGGTLEYAIEKML